MSALIDDRGVTLCDDSGNALVTETSADPILSDEHGFLLTDDAGNSLIVFPST